MGLLRNSTPPPLHQVVERAHPRDRAGLLRQLAEGDADQRRWAARDLAGEPAVSPALGAALAREPDARVREALFTALAGRADAEAAAALMPLLRSEDIALRNGAIEALAAMPAAVAPHVEALLGDPDPDVRIFAANLLAALHHEGVAGWLERLLRDDPHPNVVAAAVEAMAEAGTPAHAGALRRARARFPDDPFLGFAVDVALERIGAA